MSHIQQLAIAAPALGNSVNVSWDGIATAARSAGYDPDAAVAVAWCESFDRIRIRRGVAVVFPSGILHANNAKHALNIPFAKCRNYGTEEWDGGDQGYFGIGFTAAGDIGLGFLRWRYRRSLKTRLFGDNRQEMIAIAEERERILDVVKSLLGE